MSLLNSEDRRELKLIGITYNQIESGVYAVILQESDGDRRIPIIIGFPEAQAIECKLQEIATPRPLTHDLMVEVMNCFDLNLRHVEIYKLPNGVFGAKLIISDLTSKKVIDSRSSDAIALAIRVGAPIYTSEEVLSEVGFVPDSKNAARPRRASAPKGTNPLARAVSQTSDFDSKSIQDLEKEMQKAADNEDYELAGRIKAEINRRKNDNKD